MTPATPVERIVAILSEAGYRLLSLPLTIASVPFDFAAALVGSGRSTDLVVVIDTVVDSVARTRQKIDGLGRAMDVAGSRRPVTAVIAGPRPPDTALDALGRVCRVLPVGTPVGVEADALLHQWLSVLLPLELPDPGETGGDPLAEIGRHLPSTVQPETRERLYKAAPLGKAGVRDALHALILDGLDLNDPGREALA
jgi:hypothetical protein